MGVSLLQMRIQIRKQKTYIYLLSASPRVKAERNARTQARKQQRRDDAASPTEIFIVASQAFNVKFGTNDNWKLVRTKICW
jgi:hypothetical protein